MLVVYFYLQALTTRVGARFETDRGATAVEYGLLVALIAVVIAATVLALGQDLDTLFQNVATCISSPSSGNCTP